MKYHVVFYYTRGLSFITRRKPVVVSVHKSATGALLAWCSEWAVELCGRLLSRPGCRKRFAVVIERL